MAQPAKTNQQIEAMREGGKILAHILEDLKKEVLVGGIAGYNVAARHLREIFGTLK